MLMNTFMKDSINNHSFLETSYIDTCSKIKPLPVFDSLETLRPPATFRHTFRFVVKHYKASKGLHCFIAFQF